MEEFVKSVVQLARDFDPYDFMDNFDTVEEAEKSVMDTIKELDFQSVRDTLEEIRDNGTFEEVRKSIELLEKLEVLEDFVFSPECYTD